ncbi:NUDIX hydrolase [Parasedimentitalea maritima]|uniref:NUDIX domain-containing protein n=1 Tax=Parasedimentitalea maritima TaxID=2578117 RepID=A0A5R8ZPM6_9RHOB|nr:NUDIX hydrolase [Zongyanglinia marina]KAE9630481.1 NUDIX domain-containing protein [Zongyanglinia marina]TLP67244.1 NUDIX hydrolase [Zongyanglinia marina]
MTRALTRAWEEILRPMIFRPKRLQVAALCYRKTDDGTDVLMITSRGTGRWILPKGWPIQGKDGAQSALQEAWEEAGVKKAKIEGEPIGHYDYQKNRGRGRVETVETLVYIAQVTKLSKSYPERKQRKRQWVPVEDAANLVHEPQLRDLLRQL